MRDEAYAFGETGIGYWQPGIQALRAEGENRPSRPSNVIVEKGVEETMKTEKSAGFLDRNSADSRSIGFEWEKSPSIRSSFIPVVLKEDAEKKTVYVFQGGGTTSGGGNGSTITTDVCYTLNGMDRHGIFECDMSEEKSVMCLNDQGGAVMYITQDITEPLRAQMKHHEPIVMVFENHSQDTRYRPMGDICQSISATYGGGGNNQPFVVTIMRDEDETESNVHGEEIL